MPIDPLETIHKYLRTNTAWEIRYGIDHLTVYKSPYLGIWLGTVYHRDSIVVIIIDNTSTHIPLADPQLYQKILQTLARQ